MLYEGGGERTGEGVVKTCIKHLTMKEYIGTTRRQKTVQTDCCLELFWNNFSCTLLPVSKVERY